MSKDKANEINGGEQTTFDQLLGLPKEKEDDRTPPVEGKKVLFNDSGKAITIQNGYAPADIEELERIRRGEEDEKDL